MRLGLDIGGTKIEAVVIDNAGEIVYRERCATPKQRYGDFFPGRDGDDSQGYAGH